MHQEQRQPLLEIKNLSKVYYVKKQKLIAVNSVSFDLLEGETLALVGESGSGKSTLGKILLQLEDPNQGSVRYRGEDIFSMKGRKLLELRRRMQMIFQDPSASFNPRMNAEEILSEPFEIHHLYASHERHARLRHLFLEVGLNPDHLSRFPHEFSGGQKQRLGIARALAIEPEFIVLDEPISALDVSVQAQVINLLRSLQEKLHLTYLFIAHQLSIVKYLSHRVAVMYLGRIVEISPTSDLFKEPLHPYTQLLLSSIPAPNPKLRTMSSPLSLKGDPPSAMDPPPGCPFHPRCPFAMPICKSVYPKFKHLKNDHWTACHLYDKK